MKPKRLYLLNLVLLFALPGCASDHRLPLEVTPQTISHKPHAAPSYSEEEVVSPVLERMNARLEELGLNIRVIKADLVSGKSQHNGITLIDNDRHKQLNTHFVPGDARRNADGRNIRYLVDQSDGSTTGGLTNVQSEPAIDRAMATWNAVNCGNIPIVKRADSGVDPDIVDGLFGFGSIGTPHLADIVHAGWMPPAFFDAIFFGGGDFILGATFTVVFFDPGDLNNDGKFDVAFREIYYNNHFAWGINADPPVADVETVALHEAGHGLSQDHFGKIFIPDNSGEVQFAPFAVMNATIFGKNHELQGSDVGGHCSIWGSWPNK
jgi:hypothetical protein